MTGRLTKKYSVQCSSSNGVESVHVSALVCIVAFATLIGWVLFVMFAGVGLVALPFDLLMEYKHRPKPIKADVYQARKKIIGEQSQLLLAAAEEIERQKKEVSRTARSKFNKKVRVLQNKEGEFKRDVLMLENHYRNLELSYKAGGINALWELFKAFVGFIGWVYHCSLLSGFLIKLLTINFVL
jgi:LMBR1 domain-containing protein 1